METVIARSIFSEATGYIRRGGFAWTCNPYLGCTFGCSYCYAMFLPQNRRPREQWGTWLQAKANAVELAHRQAPRLAGQTLYLSSVTDPYLPVEASLRLTRGILEALLPYQPRLLVQTRGPLVVRDADLFRRWQAIRVHISIPTDCEAIRQRFEPKAPPLGRRWDALAQLRRAGIPVGICVTPMLPLRDPQGFVDRLCAFDPEVLVIQDFHDACGRFGADTGPRALQLLAESGWTPADYAAVKELLLRRRPVYEGEAGFFPPAAGGRPAGG
jgi:DNA repair photolyase